VADAAEDVTTILDDLGHDRFVVLGWSGGGPHAIACAALLPDRCAAAGSLAGVAPYDLMGEDWFRDMGKENVDEFRVAIERPDDLWALIEPQAPQIAAITGGEVVTMLAGLVDDVDRAALTGEFAEVMAEDFRRGVSTGVAGWHDDDVAFARPWGFDLADITVPVSVWQGEHDLMVPVPARPVPRRAHPHRRCAPLPGRGPPVARRAASADPGRSQGARRSLTVTPRVAGTGAAPCAEPGAPARCQRPGRRAGRASGRR
jgi:pimeloyl-ACP methyl ester carboxylesterase